MYAYIYTNIVKYVWYIHKIYVKIFSECNYIYPRINPRNMHINFPTGILAGLCLPHSQVPRKSQFQDIARIAKKSLEGQLNQFDSYASQTEPIQYYPLLYLCGWLPSYITTYQTTRKPMLVWKRPKVLGWAGVPTKIIATLVTDIVTGNNSQ